MFTFALFGVALLIWLRLPPPPPAIWDTVARSVSNIPLIPAIALKDGFAAEIYARD